MQYFQSKEDPEYFLKAKQADKDTEVETAFGIAVVTEGNYVATDIYGDQFGITLADLNGLYKEVDSMPRKRKKES